MPHTTPQQPEQTAEPAERQAPENGEPIEDLEPDRAETELVTGGGYRFKSNASLITF